MEKLRKFWKSPFLAVRVAKRPMLEKLFKPSQKINFTLEKFLENFTNSEKATF